MGQQIMKASCQCVVVIPNQNSLSSVLKREPSAMESFVMHQGDKIPKHCHLYEKKNGFAQLRRIAVGVVNDASK